MRPCSRPLLLVALSLLSACGSPKSTIPDRAPGERKPLSAQCDPTDPTRCGLPWPSNTFTVRDESTATQLRLSVDRTAIPLHEANITELSSADGFSRLSPIVTGFTGTIAPDSIAGSMRLIAAQPGAEDEGKDIPLKLELVPSDSSLTGVESLLIGYPLHPMAAASDHVVIVLDSLHTTDGASLSADHTTRLALGLDKPSNEDEEKRAAYHAPTRAILSRANVDPAHVLRVWDFTTRSKDDPKVRLLSMRDQLEGMVQRREPGVTIDSVVVPSSGDVAAIVEGHLTGLTTFRTNDGLLSFSDGKPVANGTHDAPFRFMIPKGTGNYRIVIFGHGTGGNYHDDLFDDRIAALGLGKLSGLFYGWDDANVVNTFLGLTDGLLHGVEKSSAGLMQAVADISAIERALDGILGDVLSAPQLNGAANPVAGRRPDVAEPIWTGGSLGGTMGLVYSGMSPRVRFAVLNVPGAGWTHFVPNSDMYELIRPGLQGSYASALDFRFALAMSQLLWDDIDGGNWNDDMSADDSIYLLQMSMGDTILPNIGSELVATTVHAIQVGKVLDPISGATNVPTFTAGASAITQYKVNASSALERHGFASKSTPAGDAAREQIGSFLASVLSGHPRIDLPSGCITNTEPNSCDFSL